MPAIIKNNFRRQSAKKFIKAVSETSLTDAAGDVLDPNSNYYLFVGKPIPWQNPNPSDTITSTNADLYPPPPLDVNQTDCRVWDEMLGLKKITAGDISLVIPRSNWETKTVYTMFDDADPNLYNHPAVSDAGIVISDPSLKVGNFYVLNSDLDLFVCLYNNNNSESLVQPTLQTDATELIRPGDGYIWKYITSITSGDAVKFLTDNWIPIKTLSPENPGIDRQKEVQDSADDNAGSVLAVVVRNTTDSAQTPLTFPNTFSGTATKQSSSGGNSYFLISGSPGPSSTNNAYVNYELRLNSGASTVVGTIVGYDATTKTITVSSALSSVSNGVSVSCEITPKLVVYSNGSSPCTFTPVVNNTSKQLTHVHVDASGLGATFVSISVVVPTVPPQSGAVAPTIRPILSPVTGFGADPEKDLGAFFVMISTQLKYIEGVDNANTQNLQDFPIKNDYRQIGILKGAVKNDGSGELCTANTLIATKKFNITFSSIGNPLKPGFDSDEDVEIISASGAVVGKAKIIDFKMSASASADTGQITVIQNPETKYSPILQGYQIRGVRVVSDTLQPTATIDDGGVIAEEVKKHSGEILYLENRRPVVRSVDQIEDIKTIIEF